MIIIATISKDFNYQTSMRLNVVTITMILKDFNYQKV